MNRSSISVITDTVELDGVTVVYCKRFTVNKNFIEMMFLDGGNCSYEDTLGDNQTVKTLKEWIEFEIDLWKGKTMKKYQKSAIDYAVNRVLPILNKFDENLPVSIYEA